VQVSNTRKGRDRRLRAVHDRRCRCRQAAGDHGLERES
jgi:hypothetical protein